MVTFGLKIVGAHVNSISAVATSMAWCCLKLATRFGVDDTRSCLAAKSFLVAQGMLHN
jgi:hypothetical protein